MLLLAFEGADWMPCILAVKIGLRSAYNAPAKLACRNTLLVLNFNLDLSFGFALFLSFLLAYYFDRH